MGVWEKLTSIFRGKQPEHLRRGALGEAAARQHLQRLGLKFLTANFRDRNGEIDLIFRDGEALAFVEVKTRTHEEYSRPADAVDAAKQLRLKKTANTYLRKLNYPDICHRFDIVEVLLIDGEVSEIRHFPNAFQPD